jgi:hypothetical protein
MRNTDVFVVVSCGVVFAAACSSSSNTGTPAAGSPGEDSGSDSTAGGSSSSGGASSDDSGALGDAAFPMMMVSLTCTSAADCTDGGGTQVCCFSLTSFATSCVAGQCAMGDYQQCASSDSECPSGYQCIASPLGMSLHYCAMGDGGSVQADTGTDAAPVDSGATDGATE